MSSFETHETPAEEPRDRAQEYILDLPVGHAITTALARVLLSQYSRQEDKTRAILDAFNAVEFRLDAISRQLLDNQ